MGLKEYIAQKRAEEMGLQPDIGELSQPSSYLEGQYGLADPFGESGQAPLMNPLQGQEIGFDLPERRTPLYNPIPEAGTQLDLAPPSDPSAFSKWREEKRGEIDQRKLDRENMSPEDKLARKKKIALVMQGILGAGTGLLNVSAGGTGRENEGQFNRQQQMILGAGADNMKPLDMLRTQRYEAGERKKEKDMSPKELSAQVSLNLNEGKVIPDDLTRLKDVMSKNEDMFGPIEGRLRSKNPWDTRAKSFESDIKMSSQTFGRFMEGGVLRKEDEIKYREMFPNLSDKYAVAQNKLVLIREKLITKYKSDVKMLKTQGWGMKGLDWVEDAIKSLPSKKISESDESKKDPKIAKYAKDYELDYSKAEEILRSRGYGKK